jgi:hypothetical protein
MPKSEAEFEAEIKKLQIEVANRDGQIAALAQEKATAVTQVEAHSTAIKSLETELKDFKAARRKNIEERVLHCVPAYKCEGKSDEVLIAFVEGHESAKPKLEEHAIPAKNAPSMKGGDATQPEKKLTSSQKMGLAFMK